MCSTEIEFKMEEKKEVKHFKQNFEFLWFLNNIQITTEFFKERTEEYSSKKMISSVFD